MLDALRQRSPLLPRDIEMPAEVNQGTLTDTLVGTKRLDQAICIVGLAVPPAFDRRASNEHAAMVVAARG